jgi:hypothetical protein
MSSAVFNRIGQDSTEVEFIQFSDNETHTTLRDELLDGEKKYVFGITSLNVPLHDCPMHPITEETTLFTVYRRNAATPFTFSGHVQYNFFVAYQGLLSAVPATTLAGYTTVPDIANSFRTLAMIDPATGNAWLDPATGAVYPGIAVINAAGDVNALVAALTAYYQGIFNPGTSAPLFDPAIFTGKEWSFKINPSKSHSSVNDFMQTVTYFTLDFNTKMTQMGIERTHFGLIAGRTIAGIAAGNINAANLVKYLEIVQQPDTSLLIQASRDFWDCFFIEFSLYGMQLFGVKKTAMLNINDRYYLAHTANTRVTVSTNLVTAVGQLFPNAFNTVPLYVTTSLPLFECCDQRVYVSVSTHLPMDSHTVIQNSVQTTSRDIAVAFFDNQAESIIQYLPDGSLSLRIKGRTYNSQTHMIRKSDLNVKWHKLNTSYRLRYLRFYLHICYKLYNETTDSFVLVKQDFPISKDSFWQMYVRFVSEY